MLKALRRGLSPIFLGTCLCTCLFTYLLTFLVNNLAHAESGDHAIYMLHCGGCHLADGVGAPPEVPGLQALGPITLLPEGRDYIVRVPGAAQAPIDDATLTLIANYILRTFNADSLPADFRYLSQHEVQAARKNTLLDPLKFRAQLWQKLGEGAAYSSTGAPPQIDGP